uniref:Hat-25 zm n=1 Tax=Rhipicephalus zambeziensis TaxID=60191 RepID=A0A224YP97_9ACAR
MLMSLNFVKLSAFVKAFIDMPVQKRAHVRFKKIMSFPHVMVLPNKTREHSGRLELLASKNNQHAELRYFNEPLIPRKDDPLKYCKEHGAALHRGNARTALRCLPIPATEVTSERMFSTAGSTITSR